MKVSSQETGTREGSRGSRASEATAGADAGAEAGLSAAGMGRERARPAAMPRAASSEEKVTGRMEPPGWDNGESNGKAWEWQGEAGVLKAEF